MKNSKITSKKLAKIITVITTMAAVILLAIMLICRADVVSTKINVDNSPYQITCVQQKDSVDKSATKAIENVRPNDTVKSYNQVTGKVENKRVLQTFENETDEIVTVITNDGQEIGTTPGHKFYVNNKWIAAEDLRAGDILVSVNGEKVVVEKIQHEILEAPIKVYNFEVQDNNTYIVGNENGVVVHNSACYKGKNKLTGKTYIGRTNRKVGVRIGEHAKNINRPRILEDVVYLDDLTYEESRILEQALINDNRGIEYLDNVINGIGKSNPLYGDVAIKGKGLLKKFFEGMVKLK